MNKRFQYPGRLQYRGSLQWYGKNTHCEFDFFIEIIKLLSLYKD
jgi:hypothetical protein